MNKKKKVFVKKDAGNVPYNTWMFNNSTKKDSSGEIQTNVSTDTNISTDVSATAVAEDLSNKKTYSYYGEVYRFDDVIDEIPFSDPIYTQAISLKQAINNIKAQLKDHYGFSYNTKLDIEERKVNLIDDDVDDFDYMNVNNKYCDECETRLTDSGLCPKCDNLELDM